MDVSINTAVLSRLLKRTAGIKSKVFPILSHVLLEARDGKLIVSASDLEVGMRVTTDEGLSVEKDGAIAVRADQLREIVGVLPGDEVGLKVLDNCRLEIVAGDFISKIAGRPRDEFPAIEGKGKKMESFSLHSDDLKAFVGACAHSMSTDETKAHLCGIYLHTEDGKLIAVSTDGHRVSLASRGLEGLPAFSVVVPRKGVEELLKLESDHLGLHVGQNSLEVIQGGTFLSIRLVEGDYPSYRRAIPSDYPNYCTVGRETLIDAVVRVRLFSSKNSMQMKIWEKGITLGASKEGDEGTDWVPCKRNGGGVSIKVDARYLLESLNALAGADVVLKYRDDLSPLVMLPADFGKWDERLAVLAALRF